MFDYRNNVETKACPICGAICIDGHYFEGREAVSFEESGFIGFCGWADSRNERAILEGFYQWMQEHMGIEGETND